jgi:hypothetical protein
MSLILEFKSDLADAKRMGIPWWGILLWMALCGLIDWLLISLGRFDLSLPALNSIAVIGFTIALKRRLGRHAWFWITIAVLAAVHVPLILLVPWSSKWLPASAFAAIDSADLCVMIWIISVVGKLLGERNVAGSRVQRL